MYKNKQQLYSSGGDKDSASGFNNRIPYDKSGSESNENESNNEETNVLEEIEDEMEEKSQKGAVKLKEGMYTCY